MAEFRFSTLRDGATLGELLDWVDAEKERIEKHFRVKALETTIPRHRAMLSMDERTHILAVLNVALERIDKNSCQSRNSEVGQDGS